ncbi:Gfo/Idh/MocA family oxidoreductase [Pseudomonas sp. MAFF 302046]|jgi:thiazolinyl imide reductase|uniref:Gfo/Idh/MocA family oxidoreductase n=1 Tax=Pseudomonas morbosilactucae TaxID=2938197 RepID=A0ABT0JMF3_9PSED|nr:Gfo/Idh/MocA family oxidoreductase [Pseudomonas morbosilactucae]MCK9817099.1 Gfo/Idh/MocA family oxidoreductase [Pseudomonas morbosilactucae]
MHKPVNVIVCGTRFGEHYLAALTQGAGSRYRLAGILARGSARSRGLAERLHVPLYHSVDQLPDSIDIACVVVRSAIVGGDGSNLAKALLERGMHVLQEHPAHPTDIARLQGIAALHGRRYHVNSFYPHLPAGQRFIDYARQSAAQRRPAFVEITTSLQLLYSSLDIVLRALGGPGTHGAFSCSAPLPLPEPEGQEPWPFRSLQGRIAGVPFVLHLQTYLDPADPDHHSLVMHRLSMGGAEGQVTLVNSYGPVVWSHPIYAPDYAKDGIEASYLLNPEAHRASRFNRQPTALTFGPANAPSLAQAVTQDFSQAIHAALDELMDPQAAAHQPTWWEAHGQAWLGIMRAVGQPLLVSRPAPSAPFPDPLTFMQEQMP